MIQGELQRNIVPVPNEELANWRIRGDRDADALVEAFRVREGIDRLEDLLVELFRWHPDAPPLPAEIAAFLAVQQDLPGWFETEGSWPRIVRGQALYQKFRRTALLILGCASLPHCYAQSEIAGTLIMSGRLASQVRARLGETANFLDEVMAPDALQGGAGLGAGLLWIRKVRLIHAVMRGLILQDPSPYVDRTDGRVGDVLLKRSWQHTDRLPIDQIEMVFVLLTFSLVVLDGWRSLGIRLSARECDDYLFTWAVIGHMLGIEDPLLSRCTTLRDAQELFREIKILQQGGQRSPEAIEAGRLLSAALLVLLRDRVASGLQLPRGLGWTRPGLNSLPRSLIRRLIGADTAAELWVEPAPVGPRFYHWCLIGLRAFGKQATSALGAEPSEIELCGEFGEKIKQEFCGGAPHVRPPG